MAITMKKGEFMVYMCSVIDSMEEGSEQYARFSELFLLACGVIDSDGNLTEEYANSPYWGMEGETLTPTLPSQDEIELAMAQGPRALRSLIMG